MSEVVKGVVVVHPWCYPPRAVVLDPQHDRRCRAGDDVGGAHSVGAVPECAPGGMECLSRLPEVGVSSAQNPANVHGYAPGLSLDADAEP